MEPEEFHLAQSRHKFWKTAHRLFVSPLQVTSPCWLAAGLRSLDFAHVPVVHDSHMPIVPGDRDRIPTRLSNSAYVSSITLPANASTLLEVLRFGGSHVAPLFARVAHTLGQTACRCLTYFPIKCGRRRYRPKSRHNRRHERTRAATTTATAGKINSLSLNFQARQQCLRSQLKPRHSRVRGFFFACYTFPYEQTLYRNHHRLFSHRRRRNFN
jgi:hypothetical protein